MHERGGITQLDIYHLGWEPKFGHQTFNCNIYSRVSQRTSQLCLNHSQDLQEPSKWVNVDLAVLWVEAEHKLHLKVDCLNFGCTQN